MTIARPGRHHFELRINRVLGGIDADRPDVAAGKFPALGGAPRSDRPRAVHALDRADMPAEAHVTKAVHLLCVMDARVRFFGYSLTLCVASHTASAPMARPTAKPRATERSGFRLTR